MGSPSINKLSKSNITMKKKKAHLKNDIISYFGGFPTLLLMAYCKST